MAIGGFVVNRRAALQDVLQLRGVEGLAFARGAPDLFGERQRRAAIAVRHAHQHGTGFLVERQRFALNVFGMDKKFFDRRGVERMKHQHPRARQ